jgi:hypothetical protein
MKFDNAVNFILQENYATDGLNFKKRLEEIEKKYGYLKDDPEFLDYVAEIIAANAEDAKSAGHDPEHIGLFDDDGEEISLDLVHDKMHVMLSDPYQFELFANDYFSDYPEKELKPHISKDTFETLGDFMGEL